MDAKIIVGLIIFLLFVVPPTIKVTSWFIKVSSNPTLENIEQGAVLIAEESVPWWVGVMDWLSKQGGGLLIVVLVLFLMWAGVIGG